MVNEERDSLPYFVLRLMKSTHCSDGKTKPPSADVSQSVSVLMRATKGKIDLFLLTHTFLLPFL